MTLYRRAALEDVAVEGSVLLPEFHSYREDAELCFRLRERGWEVVYEPSARAVHGRQAVPGRRRALSPEINRHSLKNRYLLRVYHQTIADLLVTAIPTLWRDVAAFLYVMALERSSLSAYAWLWGHRRSILERRRQIRARRTVGSWSLCKWFLRRGMAR